MRTSKSETHNGIQVTAIYNSDFSGEVIVRWGEQEVVVPGEIFKEVAKICIQHELNGFLDAAETAMRMACDKL